MEESGMISTGQEPKQDLSLRAALALTFNNNEQFQVLISRLENIEGRLSGTYMDKPNESKESEVSPSNGLVRDLIIAGQTTNQHAEEIAKLIDSIETLVNGG